MQIASYYTHQPSGQGTVARRGYDPSVPPKADRAVRAGAEPSALAAAVGRIGDRWSLLIVGALLDRPSRFGELLEAVEGIAPNVLSQRLRHLEQEAVVVAQPYSDRPPRFVYELSAAGLELAGALLLLAEWGGRGASLEPHRHGACGTALEARWYCPTCERAVEDDDAGELHAL